MVRVCAHRWLGWLVLLGAAGGSTGACTAAHSGAIARDAEDDSGAAAGGDCRSGGCPDGSHCWAAERNACTAVPSCQDEPEPNTCTAGLPGSVCSCEGLIGATDGCRHRRGAYSLYRLGSSAHSGSPCDPLHTGAFRLSLHVTVRGLHAFDGASLWLAFVFATEPSLEVAPPAPRRLPIVDGSVEWRSEPLTHSEDPGLAQLHYILDRDADGVCDPDLDLGGVLEATAVDLVSMRVSYDLGAAEVTERPAPAWVCEGFE
jgi:hypothetical protein